MSLTKYCCIVVFCGLWNVASAQDRFVQVAQPTTKNLTRVSFIDTLRGWVCGEGGVILKTTDGGRNWISQTGSENSVVMDLFVLNERLAWAVGWIYFTDTLSYYGSEIMKTTNGGASWSRARFEQSGRYFHTITFLDSLKGFIGGVYGDIERTTDGGTSWTRMAVDSSIAAGFTILNIQFATPQLGFATGGQFDITGIMWRTTNGGLNWRAESVSPEPIYALHFVDALHIIAIAGDYDYGASMLRSKDGGVRWQYTYLNIFGQPGSLSFRTPAEAWVPVGNQIMATLDTAKTWRVVDTLGWRRIFDLQFVNSNIGYAAADSGFIYKYDRKVLSVEQQQPLRPQTSALIQNYPNPFNPATTIRFLVGNLASEQKVTLEVFDVLGRSVATLVDDVRSAGEYNVVWDARTSGTGVYFYKLTVGSFVDVKKMLLIR
jgi:photosystem II stability/assembly factor-like uncharacterized protein